MRHPERMRQKERVKDTKSGIKKKKKDREREHLRNTIDGYKKLSNKTFQEPGQVIRLREKESDGEIRR